MWKLVAVIAAVFCLLLFFYTNSQPVKVLDGMGEEIEEREKEEEEEIVRWMQDTKGIVEGGYTKLVASSSEYYGHRNDSSVNPVKKLPEDSASGINTCLMKCKEAVGEDGVDAASLASVANGVVPTCQCFKVTATCSERRQTTFGFAQTIIKSSKKNSCEEQQDYYADDEGDCKHRSGYYFTSCGTDAVPIPCAPCPDGAYRANCGGNLMGTCVARKKCKLNEVAMTQNPLTDTTCVQLECPAGSEPNSFTNGCSACPTGKRREVTRLFNGEEVKLVYDMYSSRPMYSAGQEMGYLYTLNDVSNSTKVYATSESFPYIFKETSANINKVYKAKLPVGVLTETNGLFVAEEDRFVNVVFYNKKLPLKCF